MNKFWIVLSHTYLSRIKSKAFIITTLVVMLFIVAVANLESIIDLFSKDDEETIKQIAVIDETEGLYPVLHDGLQVVMEDVELTEFDGTVEEGEDYVKNDDYFALLLLQQDEHD